MLEQTVGAAVFGIYGVKNGDRVLDVGCGTGSLTFTLARSTGTSEIVGIDSSAGP